MDEPLGIGANQAPRQAGPDTGDARDGMVSIVDLLTSDYLNITISPQA